MKARPKMIHILPALIMFAITVGFVALMIVPAKAYKQKNELINFYWVGVWVFLAMIAAFSGGNETLYMLSYDSRMVAESLLGAIMLCFVLFVTFGWFRLSFKAIAAGVKHGLRNKKRSS